MTDSGDTDGVASKKILESMKKNDKFIGDILAPFEKTLGIKFNKFDKQEDPKYEEPRKKVNLKIKLKKAERKQEKMKKLNPEELKKIQWKNAINKAQGIKDKENPKVIKKVIKRKNDEKKRHRKKWAERVDKLEEVKNIREKRKKERIQKSKAKNQKKSSKKR